MGWEERLAKMRLSRASPALLSSDFGPPSIAAGWQTTSYALARQLALGGCLLNASERRVLEAAGWHTLADMLVAVCDPAEMD